jgi:SAM-dependent methyltransferase
VQDYGPSTYGDLNADVYDEMWGNREDVTPVVDMLAELAKGGRALELGIGTGRIAIPLAARGVKVEGIDGSEKMVSKMREKPGGERIPVTIGNFSEVGVKGKFSLVYIPFNTFFNLLTQEAQVLCFLNVAQHLEPGGSFLIEAFVPDMARFVQGQYLATQQVTPDLVMLDASHIHPPSPSECPTRTCSSPPRASDSIRWSCGWYGLPRWTRWRSWPGFACGSGGAGGGRNPSPRPAPRMFRCTGGRRHSYPI